MSMNAQAKRVSQAVLVLCLIASPLAAGVLIEQQETSPGSTAPQGSTRMYLDAGRLRVEAESEGSEAVVIFRADRPVAWTINRDDGTYTELTPETVAKLRQQMEQVKKQMEAQMAQMPPEQRKAVEQMMGQAMGSLSPPTVRVLGRGEQVGAYVCTRYEMLRDGARTAEIWTAPEKELNLRPEEYETLAAFARMLEPLGSRNPMTQVGGMAGLEPTGEKVEGFPVRTVSYVDGRAVSEQTLVRAERQTFDAGLFELPGGLRKVQLGEGY